MRFTKMQGAGNDFVMLDATQEPFTLTTEQIRALCDRRYGVGCDQLLVVEKSALPEVDFKYRIFNCSGGEVEMCGNGARCFAVFVRELGLTDKRRLPAKRSKASFVRTWKMTARLPWTWGGPVLRLLMSGS